MNSITFLLGFASGLGFGVGLFVLVLLWSAAQAEAEEYRRYAGGQR